MHLSKKENQLQSETLYSSSSGINSHQTGRLILIQLPSCELLSDRFNVAGSHSSHIETDWKEIKSPNNKIGLLYLESSCMENAALHIELFSLVSLFIRRYLYVTRYKNILFE